MYLSFSRYKLVELAFYLTMGFFPASVVTSMVIFFTKTKFTLQVMSFVLLSPQTILWLSIRQHDLSKFVSYILYGYLPFSPSMWIVSPQSISKAEEIQYVLYVQQNICKATYFSLKPRFLKFRLFKQLVLFVVIINVFSKIFTDLKVFDGALVQVFFWING